MSIAIVISGVPAGLWTAFAIATSLWHSYRGRSLGCRKVARYPQRVPYLGTDVQQRTNVAKYSGSQTQFLQRQFAQYGRTFQATIWGQPWIFTCDIDNIRAMNTSESTYFGVEPLRKVANSDWMGDGIFISDGEAWKQSRALFKPLFARAQIGDVSSLDKHIDDLFETIPRDGTTVDLQPLFRTLFLNVSFEYLFGSTPDSILLKDKAFDIDRFHRSFEIATIGMSKRHALGKLLIFTRDDPQWQEACDYVHSVFDCFIEAAIARELEDRDGRDVVEPLNQGPDSAQERLSMLQNIAQTTTDKQFIRDQLLNVFLGAKDTATIGISDVFFHLARHPSVWKKLRQEVLTSSQSSYSFESLKSLRYLQNVLRESLRLLSPVDVSNRICIKDCMLPRGGGPNGESPIYVRSGSRVEGRLSPLHRDPEYWGQDVEDFKPQRWETIAPKWEYIPFLGGARMCPAQQMTLTQYAYILVRFAQTFETIENRDPEFAFVEEVKFGKQSKNGVQVGLYRV